MAERKRSDIKFPAGFPSASQSIIKNYYMNKDINKSEAEDYAKKFVEDKLNKLKLTDEEIKNLSEAKIKKINGSIVYDDVRKFFFEKTGKTPEEAIKEEQEKIKQAKITKGKKGTFNKKLEDDINEGMQSVGITGANTTDIIKELDKREIDYGDKLSYKNVFGDKFKKYLKENKNFIDWLATKEETPTDKIFIRDILPNYLNKIYLGAEIPEEKEFMEEMKKKTESKMTLEEIIKEGLKEYMTERNQAIEMVKKKNKEEGNKYWNTKINELKNKYGDNYNSIVEEFNKLLPPKPVAPKKTEAEVLEEGQRFLAAKQKKDEEARKVKELEAAEKGKLNERFKPLTKEEEEEEEYINRDYPKGTSKALITRPPMEVVKPEDIKTKEQALITLDNSAVIESDVNPKTVTPENLHTHKHAFLKVLSEQPMQIAAKLYLSGNKDNYDDYVKIVDEFGDIEALEPQEQVKKIKEITQKLLKEKVIKKNKFYALTTRDKTKKIKNIKF